MIALWGVLPAQTRYEISLAEAQSGRLEITLETTCQQADCDFQMPVWSATYQIRDFAQYVTGFQAADARGEAIPVRKINPSRWRLRAEPNQEVRVSYRVLADRPGPFGAFADSQHVCLNLAQVLVYPVDGRRRPFRLRFEQVPPKWKTAIELKQEDGTYRASSYDLLIDTPVHLSDFEQAEFQHAGRRVRIVAHGSPGSYDLEVLKGAAQKIAAAGADLMREIPFSSYTFVYHFSDAGGGGMEYRNGTSIYAPAKCQGCNVSELTAHEFFHVWNVKRIRPQSLEPLDFTKANITPVLWFCEGVSSTYAQYLRLAAGLTSRGEFLEHLGRLISDYEGRPASRTQSAEESSIEAWLERYPAYGRPDRSISYYLKGELIGHLLDLTIRHRTRNRRSLDDVMRALNREYAEQGRFYEDTEAIQRIATRVAGEDLSRMFRDLVHSASPIPWDHYLSLAGFRLHATGQIRTDLGLSLSNPPGLGLVVSSVEPGGTAETAGLRRNDRVRTLNGKRAGGAPGLVLKQLESFVGRKVKMGIERNGALMSVEVIPRQARDKFHRIVELENTTGLQRMVQRGWLERRTTEPVEPESDPVLSH